MEATLIKSNLPHFTGTAHLYKLSGPIEYDDGKKTLFVVVSAVFAPFSGSETCIFPANEDGEVVDWGELDGSYRGGTDHEEAIRGAGWTLVEERP